MDNIIKQIQRGNTILLEKFLEKNMKNIDSLVKKYYGIFEDYEDLKQIAIYTFIKGIYSFDINNNKSKFISYISARIFTMIERYVLKNLNRINSTEAKFNICVKAYEKCRRYIKKEPTVDELSKYFQINKRASYEIFFTVNNPGKLDYDEIIEENKYYIEDEIIEKIDKNNKVRESIETLTDKQKESIIYRFCFKSGNIKYHDIAKANGVSIQSISSNYKGAIKKLEKKLSDIKDY